jgi:hypothetical protein
MLAYKNFYSIGRAHAPRARDRGLAVVGEGGGGCDQRQRREGDLEVLHLVGPFRMMAWMVQIRSMRTG